MINPATAIVVSQNSGGVLKGIGTVIIVGILIYAGYKLVQYLAKPSTFR